jgi:hypothetical protein
MQARADDDARVRVAIGIILIFIGLSAVVAGAFDQVGDGRVVSIVLGGAVLFFGIGMVIKGAMRTALWILAAGVFVVGGGLALFRALFD